MKWRICFTALVFGLAFALRLGGPGTVGPYDDAYHLKRIAWVAGGDSKGHEVTRFRSHGVTGLVTSKSLTHGLISLDFDVDRGVRGAFCPWPPLYDFAMGAIARILGLQSIVWIASLLFAVFAAVLSCRTGFPACPLSSANTADRLESLSCTVAGLGIALAPYLIGISRVGSIDHHWVEPMLAIGILAAVIRRSAIGLAVAMTAALFVQTALIVACGLALVAIVLIDRSRSALRVGTIAFAVSSIAVFAWRATRPPGYPDSPWFLGTTHAALLGAGAVACAIAWLCGGSKPACHSERSEEPGREGGARTEVRAQRADPTIQVPRYARNDTVARLRFPFGVIALSLAGLSLLPLTFSLVAGAHFFAGDPWLRSIVEFQPMFRDPSRIGTDLANLGGGVVALAIAMVVGRNESCGRAAARPYGIVLFFAAAYAVLSISSRRFLVPGIAMFVVAGALAAASKNRRIAAAAIALTLLPPLAYDVYAAVHREAGKPEAVRALAAEIAPLPPGRVLAPWHAGHAIDVLGRHAVVIDNFGSMPDAALFASANRALLATNPRALRDWCVDHGVRYLALADPANHVPAAAACAGLDPRTALAGRTVWERLWRGETISEFERVSRSVWLVRQTGHQVTESPGPSTR